VSTRITCFLINHGIIPSPNKITILNAFLGLLTAIIIPFNPLIGGVLVQLVSIFDGVDGEVARLTGRTSRFGAFLDSLTDRFVDTSIIVSTSIHLLHILPPSQAILLSGAVLFSSIMGSYVAATSKTT